MQDCKNHICKNCNCGKRVDGIHANANFKPTSKPSKVIRRDLFAAAEALETRFKETMKILA